MLCNIGVLENDRTSWSDFLSEDPLYSSIWDTDGDDEGIDQTEMTAL